MEFDWDEHNLSHLSMHAVTQQETEAALSGGPIFMEASIRGSEQRNLYAGTTAEGRILATVTTPRGRLPRVVTAFPAGRRVRSEYFARKGEQQ